MSDTLQNQRVSDEPYTGQSYRESHPQKENAKDNVVRDVLILMLITLAAGFLLGAAHAVTSGPIARAQARARELAQRTVMQEAESFETLAPSDGGAAQTGEEVPDGGLLQAVNTALEEAGITGTAVTQIDLAKDASGDAIGYVVTSTNAEGYGGDVELMCGITPGEDGSCRIGGISFLELTETAGMGMRAKNESFLEQFSGKTIGAGMMLGYSRNGAAAENEIDAISGCTITTRAVTKDVNAALTAVRTVLEQTSGQAGQAGQTAQTEQTGQEG